MIETFPRPLVIGYLGFDLPILENEKLGPPIATQSVLENRPVTIIAPYGPDENSKKFEKWLREKSPENGLTNKQKLQAWLKKKSPNLGITVFLNGGTYADLREQAVKELIQ